MHNFDPINRLTTLEAAEYLGLSQSTLNNWRLTGGGPVFYRAGNRIFYSRPLLDEWMDARVMTTTAQGRMVG